MDGVWVAGMDAIVGSTRASVGSGGSWVGGGSVLMGSSESAEELVSLVMVGWQAVVKMAKNIAQISQAISFGK